MMMMILPLPSFLPVCFLSLLPCRLGFFAEKDGALSYSEIRSVLSLLGPESAAELASVEVPLLKEFCGWLDWDKVRRGAREEQHEEGKHKKESGEMMLSSSSSSSSSPPSLSSTSNLFCFSPCLLACFFVSLFVAGWLCTVP